MNESLLETVDRMSRSPGVYLMKDRQGDILYIGKAKDLRSRVRAYFLASAKLTPKTEVMLSKVQRIDFMVTGSEAEAYILESNLIKKNRPKYNILLRDDKHYPYLRLSVKEDYPKLDVVRKIGRDRSRYFGPYVPGSHLRTTLDLIEKTFPLRKCKNRIDGKRERPCLNAQIGRCLAPCTGSISKAEYSRMVRQAVLFLQGKNRPLIRELSTKMEQASRSLEFEKAAVIRDQIRRIEKMTEQQKIISPNMEDKDVFGTAMSGETVCAEILFVRGGKLLGKEDFFIERPGDEKEEEILRTTMMQYYSKERLIPPLIFAPFAFAESETMEKAFSAVGGRRVRMRVPQRGINLKLVRMADENAALALQSHLNQRDRDLVILKDLQDAAGLKKLPLRIEAFDISNIQGEYPVASMVVFEKGKPLKSHYRHYRIQSVEGPNDYAMIFEVLTRRYGSGEDAALPMPDLILIDGGKGQLNILLHVAGEQGFTEGTDFMALAKPGDPDAGKNGVDRIYLPGRREPVVLDPADPVIHLIQRIRDESHRFAVTYYRKLHTRDTLTSRLKEIKGIGKTRTLSLLRHFGSLERVRRASLKDLAQAPSMNLDAASRVFNILRQEAGLTK